MTSPDDIMQESVPHEEKMAHANPMGLTGKTRNSIVGMVGSRLTANLEALQTQV